MISELFRRSKTQLRTVTTSQHSDSAIGASAEREEKLPTFGILGKKTAKKSASKATAAWGGIMRGPRKMPLCSGVLCVRCKTWKLAFVHGWLELCAQDTDFPALRELF